MIFFNPILFFSLGIAERTYNLEEVKIKLVYWIPVKVPTYLIIYTYL